MRGMSNRPAIRSFDLREMPSPSQPVRPKLVQWTDGEINPSQGDMARQSMVFSYGRPSDLASRAMPIWWAHRDLFKDKHVLIVGSGLGACAASAYHGGCVRVIGHDKREDLPSGVLSHLYVPPIVKFRGAGSIYAQSDSSWNTSGDWFDPSVASALLKEVHPSSMVVLDISSDEGRSTRAIRMLLDNDCKCEIVVRCTGGRHRSVRIVGFLARVGEILSVREVTDQGSCGDVLVHGIIRRRSDPRVSSLLFVEEVVSQSCPVGKRSLRHIASQVFFPIGATLPSTVRLCCQVTLAVLLSYKNDASSRPRYSEWTDILHVVVVSQLLLLENKDQYIERALEIRRRPWITVEGFDDHPIRVTGQLIYLIENLAIRLARDMDSLAFES